MLSIFAIVAVHCAASPLIEGMVLFLSYSTS